MTNAGLEEAQAGIKIARRNTNNLRWYHPYGRKWRGTKKPLDESERGEWKSWLKPQHSENEDHGIWSYHFRANRWRNNGSRGRLYFLGVQNHCGQRLQPIKGCLLLGRKPMTNLDSIFKSRDITLPTKVHLWFFQWSCMDVNVGLWRKLNTEELMLLNCGVGEYSWESLWQQGNPTSPS